MSSLSDSRFASIRGLIDGLPDTGLNALRQALQADPTGSAAVAEVGRLAGLEAADRAVRDRVLDPILPLCTGRADSPSPLQFPSAAPRLLWSALRSIDPDLVQAAAEACSPVNEDRFPISHDEACRRAADGLRRRAHPTFVRAAEAANAERSDGAEELAACLELAPTARRAIARLKDWLGRPTNERVAAARLLLRDASGVAEDAGPRMMAMLQARLPHPAQVLRIISMMMDRPSDEYVAASELAAFGERLMDEVDRQSALFAGFRPETGPQAAEGAARAVEAAAVILAEFDDGFRMSRGGPWGARLLQQRRVLAAAAEGRLKMVEGAVAAALPLASGFRRSVRGRPNLRSAPDPERILRAQGLTALLHHCRNAAALAGFEALRAKVFEEVQDRIDQYVEDLLEKLHAEPHAEDASRVRAYLDVAAELSGLLTEQKSADVVRRRAAVA